MDERELPTNKIHDYVTWPTTTQIFEDGRGGLAFPDQNNSNCRIEDGHLVSDEGKPVSVTVKSDVSYNIQDDEHDEPYETPVSARQIAFTPSYSVDIVPDQINFRVAKFTHEEGVGELMLTDEIPQGFIHTSGVLKANTPDTLECTTLVAASIALDRNYTVDKVLPYHTSDIKIGSTSLPFDWDNNVTFDFYADLAIDGSDEVYVYLSHQDDASTNGVYCYTKGNVRKVAFAPIDDTADADALAALTDPTVNDNVECDNHYRKAYSHREVYDATHQKIGEVTGFGVKSMAMTDCDGGLVDWFTSNGEVNIGNGHSNVFVTGFGLGGMYNAASANVTKQDKMPRDDYDENDRNTLHPWLEWAYGTRYDAQTSTNVAALPRDWPFTYMTSERPIFNRLTDTSNITFVKSCEEGVGNLERDVETGEIDPETQEPITEHVFNNRHHIVLYPDYRKITNKQGYQPGSVVVKPLFLHLPATLDTKDGETIDITMSIQNVDPEAFGDGQSPEAALSGYYAAMAQPRVYVMGGVQYFSNKKLLIDTIDPITVEEGEEPKYTFKSSNTAYKNDGKTPLDRETRVRANIVAMNGNSTGERRTFPMYGVVISSDDTGCEIEFTGEFPYPDFVPYDRKSSMGRRKTFNICGMAYLVSGDNPSETPMGLVSREFELHRNEGDAAGDAGAGSVDAGDLDAYNKFYAIDSDNEHMVNMPKVDKRYVLATVYQTATSTFPWALSNRRKLATISQSWTDEFDRDRDDGHKSLLHLIYDENRRLYNTVYPSLLAADEQHRMKTAYATRYLMSMLSTASWVSIASFMRIALSPNYNDSPMVIDSGNPVRVANHLVGMLADDFKTLRILAYKGNKKPRTKISSISINAGTTWPEPNDVLSADITAPNQSSTDWNNVPQWGKDMVNSAWCSKLRNLPEYITKPEITIVPCIFSDTDANHWFSYVSDENYPYKCDDLEQSSAATETLPYTPDSKCRRYSSNSVINLLKSLVYNNSEAQQNMMIDVRRYAETVSAIRINEEDYMTLPNIGGTSTYEYDTMDDSAPSQTIHVRTEAPSHTDTEWMNPFTNIQSIDTVPYPEITMEKLAELPENQRVFASADVAQMYRYEYDDADDDVTSVSSVMPTETDLAKCLESYVTAYAANLDLHQYQGSRVLLENGKFKEANDPIYVRTISRIKKRMDTSRVENDIVAHYVNDCFGNTTAESRDPNVDHADVNAVSIGMSAPPYVTPSNYKNQTYTRVYMQFTFSQKAGRWYTTEYRQYPTNYLSPLYGADALGATLPSLWTASGSITVKYDTMSNKFIHHEPERNIWRNPLCDDAFGSYRSNMYLPYSFVPPMDITLGCVPYLTTGGVYDYDHNGELRPEYRIDDDSADLRPLSRLERPYLPIEQGGIGLYPPANVNGGYSMETNAGIHANFWSVRKFIRPAVSVLAGTDVPGHDEYPESGTPAPSRKGGVISDATLYRMFDFPTAGVIDYRLPSTTDPDDDIAKSYLLYHEGTDDGIIRANASALGYGVSESEQDIDRN